MSEPVFASLTEERLEGYIDVVARSRASNPYERRLSLDEARSYTVDDPDFDPEGAWLASVDGRDIGHASVIVEKRRLEAGINDGYVDVEVVPEHRGRGVERALLEKALGRLRERGVHKARTRCMTTDTWRRELLEGASFEERYRVYLLVRRGRDRVPETTVPAGFSVEYRDLSDCTDDDIEDIVAAFNEAFHDHPDFSPEDPRRFTNFRDSSEERHIAILGMKGSEIAGLALSQESVRFNEERGTMSGWVDLLGVRPSYRGKGLGKALLARGTQWVLDQGMDTVRLGVFAENEKALGLYMSFGFEKERESIWFAKEL